MEFKVYYFYTTPGGKESCGGKLLLDAAHSCPGVLGHCRSQLRNSRFGALGSRFIVSGSPGTPSLLMLLVSHLFSSYNSRKVTIAEHTSRREDARERERTRNPRGGGTSAVFSSAPPVASFSGFLCLIFRV